MNMVCKAQKNHKLISLGVIPCVNVDAPENTDTEKAVLQTNIGCYMRGPYAGIEHILTELRMIQPRQIVDSLW